MVCRDPTRGEDARKKIINEFPQSKVELLLYDCSLKSSVKKLLENTQNIKWDVVILNAGALLHEKTPTSEGYETTFACHLAFGAYYITKHIIKQMNAGGRIIAVSSGGMYNTKVPSW